MGDGAEESQEDTILRCAHEAMDCLKGLTKVGGPCGAALDAQVDLIVGSILRLDPLNASPEEVMKVIRERR